MAHRERMRAAADGQSRVARVKCPAASTSKKLLRHRTNVKDTVGLMMPADVATPPAVRSVPFNRAAVRNFSRGYPQRANLLPRILSRRTPASGSCIHDLTKPCTPP